jgi:hypothetical protein
MEESICQSETLQNIRTGKKLETVRQNIFVPDIPEENYHSFKDYVDSQDRGTRKNTKRLQTHPKLGSEPRLRALPKVMEKRGRGMRMRMSVKFPPLPARPWESWTGTMGAAVRSATSNKRN